MEFPVIINHKDIVLKLFNWLDYPKDQAAKNVEAYDKNGNLLWVIESLDDNTEADYYTNISSKNGEIHAFNFQCYNCVIDESSGKVISKKFTK